MYALAAGRLPQRMRVGRVGLRVFAIGPIAAIAGTPRAAADASEEALREQHSIVLALAERLDPLLPARFGSRMTAARIEAAIRPSVAVLTKALEHVRGRRQMTVRLAGPAVSEAPAPLPTTGTAYLAQRRAAAHALPAEAAPLQEAVQSFVIDSRVQAGRGAIRATLFHLISLEDVSAYRDAIALAIPQIAPWQASVTGPWPPFAFAPELNG